MNEKNGPNGVLRTQTWACDSSCHNVEMTEQRAWSKFQSKLRAIYCVRFICPFNRPTNSFQSVTYRICWANDIQAQHTRTQPNILNPIMYNGVIYVPNSWLHPYEATPKILLLMKWHNNNNDKTEKQNTKQKRYKMLTFHKLVIKPSKKITMQLTQKQYCYVDASEKKPRYKMHCAHTHTTHTNNKRIHNSIQLQSSVEPAF